MKKILILLTLGFIMWCHATETVMASKFGFNAQDATACLQKAIDSGARQVIVDNVGKPWKVQPITLRSNLDLVFASGVRVQAKPGEFKGLSACLFRVYNCKNVTMRGLDRAVLAMNKKDYQNTARYRWSEWRNLISIKSSTNVKIQNLKLVASGGDGIYIGSMNTNGFSQNIVVENVEATEHHRQGMSVISVKNLQIKNCKFNQTSGTAPQAGIDFEPNNAQQYLNNIVVENTQFNGNAGCGLMFHVDAVRMPLTAVIRNCQMNGNSNGISVTIFNKTRKCQADIRFENCQIKDNWMAGLSASGMHQNCKLTFKNCQFDTMKGRENLEVQCESRYELCNLHFDNVTLRYKSGEPLGFKSFSGAGIKSITGNLKVINSKGQAKKFNFAQFCARHKTNRELLNFVVAPLNLKTLVPYQNSRTGKNGAPNTVFRSRNLKLVQYVPAGGAVPLQLKFKKITRYDLNFSVIIRDVDGHPVKQFKVKSNNFNYVLKSNVATTFIIEILNGYANGILLNSAVPGQAVWTSGRTGLFHGGQRLYFVVPAGVKDINIEIKPHSGEPVQSQLLDSQGKMVLSFPRSAATQLLKYSRDDAAQDEVWSFKIPWAKEDFNFRMGAPLAPIVSTAPENLLINR